MNPAAPGRIADAPRSVFQVGRMFVHPAFDYLLIGGGLSLLVTVLLARAGLPERDRADWLVYLILFSNSAHFAASSVRLYTKPGAVRSLPFLSLGFPLVLLVVLTLAIVFSEVVGRHFHALYLTWSPYHYAAQTYGLAVMYAYRSGCQLSRRGRQLFRWTCLLPFVYAFLAAETSGLAWFVPRSVYAAEPILAVAMANLVEAVGLATFAMPLVLVAWQRRENRTRLPLISLLLIVSNAVWWIVLPFFQAFVLATVFHGIQYLAIVTIFHVRDQEGLPDNRHAWGVHALKFYSICLVLGYALFNVWPYAYVAAGFALAESVILVSAVINIHHFIVDRYVWQLRNDSNYRIVVGEAARSAPS